MSSLALQIDPRAEHVHCTDDELVVALADGRTLSIPLAWFPRLVNAPPEDRAEIELLGGGQGIHWPVLDEDISILGLLAGNPSFERMPNKRFKPTVPPPLRSGGPAA